MKYIIMSFQPKWLALIMNRTKTTEIRTRIPECLKNGEPVTVLGYCAKSTGGRIAMNNPYLFNFSTDKNFLKQCGADIYCLSTLRPIRNVLNGLVCCKFVVEKVDKVGLTKYTEKQADYWANEKTHITITQVLEYLYDEVKGSCLTEDELNLYGKGDTLYALHLTALTVFDKPMPLYDFKHEVNVWVPEYQAFTDELRPVTRAPQSWMYIAEPAGVGEW
jgi:predicted transcriptional regulator